ncbi:TIGR03943 family putative permease subunit [Bacillus sp. FJAT-42315]|uniref:TIGR03943 family putative permease subunit n=1 Tax=Bacillus sp. FJAT-42315 TaxID=2014077 RepID=UPI000C2472AB|nr:TIGR03943 family protein [Bacillus sp. FJAT-42315]
MKFQSQQAFRALILLTFALFLWQLHYRGEISQYINPKYELLSQLAAGLFLFLFIVQLTRVWVKKASCSHHDCDHDHGDSDSRRKKIVSYSILIFPLATGFLLPATTLNASIAAKKGIAPLPSESSFEEQEPLVNLNEMSDQEYNQKMNALNDDGVITLTDDVFEPYYGEINAAPSQYTGKKIKMTGFVFKEGDFESNQLVLARFLITHCVADATTIGFLTEIEEAAIISQDTWLEIEGTLAIISYNGASIPLVKDVSWKEIPEPAEPYVFPVLTVIR